MKNAITKTTSLCFAVLMLITALVGAPESLAAAQSAEFTKTAAEFISGVNVGWNLGNQFDADPVNESAWSGVEVTTDLIDAVAAKGFNAIRIPVTWIKSADIDKINDDNTVPEYFTKRLERIKSLVDYALGKGMYVTVNIHHDGWIKSRIMQSIVVDSQTGEPALISNNEARDKMVKNFGIVWTRIADRFKDCGERLMFEAMNEVRDGDRWNASEKFDNYNINLLHAEFVRAVRATGGNNAKRYLIMMGYAGSTGYNEYKTDNMFRDFVIPDDPAKHLIFAVHAYMPNGFSMLAPGESGSVSSLLARDYSAMDFMMYQTMRGLKEAFIDKGVPVIIDEFGSINKNNESERIKHAQKYIEYAGKYGVKCWWWDNNTYASGKSESYGLIDYSSCKWQFESIADALVAAANACNENPVIQNPDPILPKTTDGSFRYLSGNDIVFNVSGNNSTSNRSTDNRFRIYPMYSTDDYIVGLRMRDTSGIKTDGMYYIKLPDNIFDNDPEKIVIQLSMPNGEAGSGSRYVYVSDSVGKIATGTGEVANAVFLGNYKNYKNEITLDLNGTHKAIKDNKYKYICFPFDPISSRVTASMLYVQSIRVYETITTLYGDLNGDKLVNAKDLLRLMQYLANIPVTIDFTAADVNADKVVNAKDLLCLKKHLSGWQGITLGTA